MLRKHDSDGNLLVDLIRILWLACASMEWSLVMASSFNFTKQSRDIATLARMQPIDGHFPVALPLHCT